MNQVVHFLRLNRWLRVPRFYINIIKPSDQVQPCDSNHLKTSFFPSFKTFHLQLSGRFFTEISISPSPSLSLCSLQHLHEIFSEDHSTAHAATTEGRGAEPPHEPRRPFGPALQAGMNPAGWDEPCREPVKGWQLA